MTLVLRYPASLANDKANFVNQFAWCLRSNGGCANLGLGDGTTWSGAAKPWLWGEFDAGTTVWNQVNPLVATGDGRICLLHNSPWAGLFSPRSHHRQTLATARRRTRNSMEGG